MKVLVGYKKSNLDDRMLDQAANVVKTMGGKLYLFNSAVGGMDVPKSEFDDREKDLTQAKKNRGKYGRGMREPPVGAGTGSGR